MLTVPPRDRLKDVERSPIAAVGAGGHNHSGDAVPPASTHSIDGTTTIMVGVDRENRSMTGRCTASARASFFRPRRRLRARGSSICASGLSGNRYTARMPRYRSHFLPTGGQMTLLSAAVAAAEHLQNCQPRQICARRCGPGHPTLLQEHINRPLVMYSNHTHTSIVRELFT